MKKILIITLITFLTSLSLFAQDATPNETITNSITAVFEEFDGEYYAFKYIDEDGFNSHIFFDFINDNLIKKFDLTSNEYVGKTFDIDYNEDFVIKNDEQGESEEYTQYTIINLTLK